MKRVSGIKSRLLSTFACAAVGLATGSAAHADQGEAHPSGGDTNSAAHKPLHLDRSGRTRVGQASFYAEKYQWRKMADGTPMNPRSNNAASKTLPLGTLAKVTNLETGRSAVVTIRDRGPFVNGRIVDLSPYTAQKIGLRKQQGITRVEVTPIALPQAD